MIAKFKILPQESTESSVDIFLFHRQLLLLPWPHEPFLSFSASPPHEPPFAVVPAPPCDEPLPCFSFLNPEKNGVAPHSILLTLSLALLSPQLPPSRVALPQINYFTHGDFFHESQSLPKPASPCQSNDSTCTEAEETTTRNKNVTKESIKIPTISIRDG